MVGNIGFCGRSVRIAVTLCLFVSAAGAQSEKVLYNFCPDRLCSDGSNPSSGVIFDQSGNLYGTTSGGGNLNNCGGCGVVFKLTPSGKETALYSFCAHSNCTDGQNPLGGVIRDVNGNLYGTTSGGGANAFGNIYKISTAGKYTALYNFCAKNNCADGGAPFAGLIFGQGGNLYGTTADGGANGMGTVFKFSSTGKEIVLYSFCAYASCPDGSQPMAPLVSDKQGNLYGTTPHGGYMGSLGSECSSGGCGVLFKVSPSGKETVLHTFCDQQQTCIDGWAPLAGLTFDKAGNLYGTTFFGGAHDEGTVFKVTPSGEESILYSFCADGGQVCTDGSQPTAGLVFDQRGNLYGTTTEGGTFANGAVFKLAPSGTETVLYSFCSAGANCPDGANPAAPLVFDKAGNLYSTTPTGGAGYLSVGTVFELIP